MNDDFVYVKIHSLSDDTCDDIIKLFESDPNVHEGITLIGLDRSYKRTNDLRIDITDPRHKKYDEILYNELHENLNKYLSTLQEKNIMAANFKNVSDQGFQIQKYIKNDGFYKYHVDQTYNFNKNKIRIIAFIWYLNTVHVGGETEFLNGKYKIKPETGKLLLFPALWTYPHKGNIPISNDKYIITGFIYANMIDEIRTNN